jgi:ParB family chromosome partitioning protein
MKLRRVDPNKIKVPEVRVTARFDEETWRQFQESIRRMGPVSPVICCEVEGELVLVDGLHRLVEAINSKTGNIDVAVMPGDMVDVLTRNLFLDHLRGKTPVSEMVKVIAALWKEFGLDSEQIAAKTGMTRDYVEKLQLISELTPLCLEALDEGRITVGHAFAITKLKDPIRQDTVLAQLELYHWKVKELEAYIKSVLEVVEAQEQEAVPAEARPPVKVKCVYCHDEFDPSEVACPITCRGCSGIMFASMAQARQQLAQEQAQAGKASEATKRAPQGDEILPANEPTGNQ